MFCPNCGRDNLSEKNYCPSCGISLAAFKEALSNERASKSGYDYIRYIIPLLVVGGIMLQNFTETPTVDTTVIIIGMIVILLGYRWYYENKQKKAWQAQLETTKLPGQVTTKLPEGVSPGSITEHTTHQLELEPVRDKEHTQR
jgi:uncharacterized membrane protein YvbJ